MAQTERPGLSVEQKRELWRRWKEGESLSEIGRALERGPGSIFGVVISEEASRVKGVLGPCRDLRDAGRASAGRDETGPQVRGGQSRPPQAARRGKP